MVGETQIPKPSEAPRNHNLIKLLIFISLRADLVLSVHSDTPCTPDSLAQKYAVVFSFDT